LIDPLNECAVMGVKRNCFVRQSIGRWVHLSQRRCGKEF
jgi:hypothetical protein